MLLDKYDTHKIRVDKKLIVVRLIANFGHHVSWFISLSLFPYQPRQNISYETHYSPVKVKCCSPAYGEVWSTVFLSDELGLIKIVQNTGCFMY